MKNPNLSPQARDSRDSEQIDVEQRSGDNRDFSRDDGSPSGAATLARVSDLMNATVGNVAGEKLGDIDELAMDPDSNRVVYGVLRRGGFLGMGEARYAVPSSVLTPSQDGRIVLALDESQFENISGFDNNNWPTRAEPKLSLGRHTDGTVTPAAKRIVKVTNVIGCDVQCSDGHTLGEISDLVVEPRSGRVIYAVVKSDRGHMPIPMDKLSKSDKTYSLLMSMDKLRSMPILDAKREPGWGDESWNRSIHESYGTTFEAASARGDRRSEIPSAVTEKYSSTSPDGGTAPRRASQTRDATSFDDRTRVHPSGAGNSAANPFGKASKDMVHETKTSGTTGIDSASRSEHQRTRDPSSFTDERHSDQSGTRDLNEKASDVGDTIAEKAKSAGESIKESGEGFVDRAKDAHSTMCKFTQDNPTASILIAFGAGVVLARMLPKW